MPQIIRTFSSGYFQGFDRNALMNFAEKNDLLVKFLHPEGTYLLENQSLLEIYPGEKLNKEDLKSLMLTMDFYNGQPVDHNFYYGFHQLTEVALKALSPGVNDPETAILSLNALMDLFYYRLNHHPSPFILNESNQVRVVLCSRSFAELFTACILPIWDYGSKDRFIQNTVYQRVIHLQEENQNIETSEFLSDFLKKSNY